MISLSAQVIAKLLHEGNPASVGIAIDDDELSLIFVQNYKPKMLATLLTLSIPDQVPVVPGRTVAQTAAYVQDFLETLQTEYELMAEGTGE